ncbi:hypothetical protein MBANPS3_005344 [Mucor bainieri]
MMNRKTKRNSPPPLHTTTAAVLDHKLTETGFAKWSKVLQLISPPNKKRRAVALIGRSCENSDEDEYSDEASESESENEESDEDDHQEKMLNRRAMYIPNPVQQQQCHDGPKDAWHKWTLYRATHHKLRRSSLPLREGLHLRQMLVHLQQDESIRDHIQQQQQQQQHKAPARRNHSNNDDEDDIPLGTLLENKKLATAVPARCSSPPLPPMMTAPATKPKAFYQRMLVTRPPPAALNLLYRQPCYYYNNMQSFPVQFI